MLSFYQPAPWPAAPATPVYQPHEMVPLAECACCGQPIYRGQRATLIYDGTLDLDQNGQIVIGSHPEVEGPALVHDTCSAEYAHDYITKEACAAEASGTCQYCSSKLDTDDDE